MSSKTILMVEDNPTLRRTNRLELEREDYRVLEADTLEAAKKIADREPLDLILLDIMLPDGSGLDACRELSGNDGPRILFLSALKSKADVIAGLRAGDDYITKTYKMAELLARVEVLLKKDPQGAQPSQIVTRGPLELDVVAAQAFLFGEDMLLSGKEFALLLFLVQNQGEVLDKDTVYQAVWGQPMSGDSKALFMTVSRLKKKLAPAAAQGVRLTSRRGEGYRFTFDRQEAQG